MASRAAARGLLLLKRRGFLAPAGHPLASTRHAVRGVANTAVAPSLTCTCEKELLDLRKEMMLAQKQMADGDQRLWLLYEALLDVNHKMIMKMAANEAESVKRQAAAMEAMVKTSYRILASGGMFMFCMFSVLTPLLKATWQNDTIEEMDRRKEKSGPEGKGPKEDDEATGERAPEKKGDDDKKSKGFQGTTASGPTAVEVKGAQGARTLKGGS